MTELAAGLKAERRRASVLLRQGNNAVELLDAELPAVIDYLTRVMEERQAPRTLADRLAGRVGLIHSKERRPRLSTLDDTETGTRWTDRDERTFASQPE